jgi:hypothetical protein
MRLNTPIISFGSADAAFDAGVPLPADDPTYPSAASLAAVSASIDRSVIAPGVPPVSASSARRSAAVRAGSRAARFVCSLASLARSYSSGVGASMNFHLSS